jgi:hypothetical protein
MGDITRTPLIADAERVRLEDGALVATVWEIYPSKERMIGESWMEMMSRTEAARNEAHRDAIERASLFAAAPELYEALKEIIDTEWIGGKGGFVKARAALAKARGES